MPKVLIKGNEAIAESAVRGGCRYFFGYPITPQSEIPEYMSRRLPEVDGFFLQAESETAAINMVYGAAAAGARVMTSSSSPGISLKAEGISYIAAAQLPCVIVNVMRGGPGLGSITPAQSDYFQAVKGGGHGDYRLLVYAPASVQEAADLTFKAFDRADFYRTPVMILADAVTGQMMESAELPEAVDIKTLKPKPWAACGNGGKRKNNVINSLFLEIDDLAAHNAKLQSKYAEIAKNEVSAEEYKTADAEIIFAAYGIIARVAKTAVDALREKGVKAGLIRPVTLWPFPDYAFGNALKNKKLKKFIVLELSAGQMVEDVRLAVNGARPVEFFGRAGGAVFTPEEIMAKAEGK